MTTRKELVEALRLRYRSAASGDRTRILDEFVALTGYVSDRRNQATSESAYSGHLRVGTSRRQSRHIPASAESA
jgi:hypothetical protein